MKDSNNFFCKLDAVKSGPNNTYLVSFDVKSLYPNIPNVEGAKAIKEFFEKRTSNNVAAEVITTFLALLLTLTFCSAANAIFK